MHVLILVAALSLVVGGCSPSPDRSPQEAAEAARAALDAGDADRALSLFKRAADGGHLGALRTVADAHTRGYLTIPAGPGRAKQHVAVRSLPGEARQARRAYDHALADSVRAGQPNALLRLAHDLTGSTVIVDGQFRSSVPEASRDSATALYTRLVRTDVPRLSLALLAGKLGNEDAYRRHTDEAVAAGEPQACETRVWSSGSVPNLSIPTGFAAYLDQLSTCPGAHDGSDSAADALRTLDERVAAGNAEAAAFLDSLHALGVFRRHPRLATVLRESRP